MTEVRARARERIRWGAGLGLLAFALPVCPRSLAAREDTNVSLKYTAQIVHAYAAISARSCTKSFRRSNPGRTMQRAEKRKADTTKTHRWLGEHVDA